MIVALFIILIIINFVINTKLQQPHKQLTQKIAKTTVANNKPITILIPDEKAAALGTSTSATLRMYTSPDGGYSITYPSEWTPSVQNQLKNFAGDIFVFTTGPVGNKILGYPSFLQVAVDENPQRIPLTSFISKHFGTINLSSIIMAYKERKQQIFQVQSLLPQCG